MVYQSRARKRIHAIHRGPDGSAFQKCETCGAAVAIALADMHDCGNEKNTRKKQKTQCRSGEVKRERIEGQPRSAFHFFMEEFKRTSRDGNEMQMMKRGWEAWMAMSREEWLPFMRKADELHLAYMKLLKEEENMMQRVDDEADSSEVGKYDGNYENFDLWGYDSDSFGGSGLFLSETDEKLDPELIVGAS